MRRIRWALILTSAMSLSAWAPPVHAAEPRISEEARGYFKNGVELLRAENYQDAYYQFRLAYEKSQSWKVLGNLGFCALQLERDGEALAYYEEYLKRGGKEVNAEERASIERDMLLVRGNAGTVELTASRPDVELVDVRGGSRVAGQYYALGEQKQTLLLRGGSHTLTATSKDGRVLRWEVVLRPGKTVSHHFDFEAPEPAAGASPPTSAAVAPPSQAVVATEPEARGAPLRTVGFIGVGVGAAALGAGVITGVLAKKRETEATDQCDANKVCALGAEEDFDAATSLATVTNVLFIGGGVIAAAGVGLVLFGGNDDEASSRHAVRLELRPEFGRGAAGLTAFGVF